jgi:hypothetical protein
MAPVSPGFGSIDVSRPSRGSFCSANPSSAPIERLLERFPFPTLDLKRVKVRMGPGPKFPVGTEIPVIWTIFPGFN